jgi:deoxyribodipyrimidine photo-lyase
MDGTDWAAATPPSREGALARLAAVRPSAYARTRNHLDGAVSGLSPYLTHGVLTLPEVLASVHQRAPLDVGHKFVYELGWREYFRHVWQFEGNGIFESLHAGPQPEHHYAQALPADIREGCTGVPVIDRAVQTLYRTGTLHNHARMWLASYVVHLRHVHWKAGADWMVTHLLDGDLASNHLSWQWVAGTGSHKPYLFNAENVARYAPPAWHSPGSIVDRTYSELEAIARGQTEAAGATASRLFEDGIAEPALRPLPPDVLSIGQSGDVSEASVEGRDVWLVHPWALRAPPPEIDAYVLKIGIYPAEHYRTWPWPAVRWAWVDAAMQAQTVQRLCLDVAGLAGILAKANRVWAFADPHIEGYLPDSVTRVQTPRLFPEVTRRCTSFSQWWTRATRGLRTTADLL